MKELDYKLVYEEYRPRVRDLYVPNPSDVITKGWLLLFALFLLATCFYPLGPHVRASKPNKAPESILSFSKPKTAQKAPERSKASVLLPTSVELALPLLMPPIASANMYYSGQCVWWVYLKRAEIGHAIPGWWGNAYEWVGNATYEGYAVGETPIPGAVGVRGNHVVFVEEVTAGAVLISEANYDYVPYHTRERWASIGEFAYIY